MTTGEKIANIRNRLGLSIRKFALLMGVSPMLIIYYERNVRIPKLTTIRMFQRELAKLGINLSIEDIVTEE